MLLQDWLGAHDINTVYFAHFSLLAHFTLGWLLREQNPRVISHDKRQPHFTLEKYELIK